LQARTPGSPFKSLEHERYEYVTPRNNNTIAKLARLAYSDFNTSKSYAYQKMKFEWDRAQKGDKVDLFQQFNSAWKSDKFLTNNYKYTSIQSREGRKLNLSDFYKRFKDTANIKK